MSRGSFSRRSRARGSGGADGGGKPAKMRTVRHLPGHAAHTKHIDLVSLFCYYAFIMNAKKPIRLSQHAREQIVYRGCSEEEIGEAIRTAKWEKAELGRLQCQKDFAFNKTWNNKKYKTKQVKPIFIEEPKEIIVVTVYAYYF